MPDSTTRRRFLKTSALTLGLPTFIPAAALGRDGHVAPSNRIVVGGIGIGGRGRKVLNCFLNEKDVQFVAVADVQEERREAARQMVMDAYKNDACTTHRDMFELTERDDIDALLICTGDRWHALASIFAAKSGKDVYCEKPCSTTIEESNELADAFERYQRIFQGGTQRRNVQNFQYAGQLARSGQLGKIQTVHASILRLESNQTWLPAEPEPDPAKIDWDRWLGPAPWRPFNKRYLRGRWRGHDDFHCGYKLPDWGSHTIDLCQWAANVDDTVPIEYEPVGDTIEASYANGIKLVMRLAGFKGEGDWKVPGTCPIRYEGADGWVEAADSGKLAASSPSLLDDFSGQSLAGTDAARHVRDFLDCVKSRRQPSASAPITRNGHIAAHAAAIAWRLDRKVTFDPKTSTFLDDDQANRLIRRARRAPWHP